MNGEEYDLVVVGAGIGGLLFAHQGARAGWRVAVLEKANRVGGVIHTHRLLSGYWLELGAHTCFNSYGALLGPLDYLGMTTRLLIRKKLPYRLWSGGEAESIPLNLRLGELLLHAPRILWERKEGRTVEEYYSRVAGKRNYESLLGPAFDAVICQPAGQFPADSLFRRKARRNDLPRSFTFSQGLSTMAERLADQPEISLSLDDEAIGIENEGTGFAIESRRGGLYRTRRLCLATPPDIASQLLGPSSPELGAHLAKIEMRQIESLGITAPLESVHLAPMAGLIGRNTFFYSMVSRDVVPDPRRRGFTFHFRPDRLDAEGKRALVQEILGVRSGNGAEWAETVSRLPALRRWHSHWLAETGRLLQGRRLALVGNYFEGISIGDVAQRAESEFKRLAEAE